MYAKNRAMFRKQGIDAQLRFSPTPHRPSQLCWPERRISSPHTWAMRPRSSREVPRSRSSPRVRPTIRRSRTRLSSPLRGKSDHARPRPRRQDDRHRRSEHDRGARRPQVAQGERRRPERRQDPVRPVSADVGPLIQGTFDAAFVPEPYRTQALEQGARRIANPFQAVCTKVCVLTFWIARASVDPNLAARFRNAIQSAAVWANQRKNDEISGKILAKYTGINAAVIKKMTRTTFATRLRVSLAQPWLDVFAEYGVIPARSSRSTSSSSRRARAPPRPRATAAPVLERLV